MAQAYIEGFYERLDEACHRYGKSKAAIAKQCGFDRKNLIAGHDNRMMCSGYVAKFCALTGTDANWLLGVNRSFKEDDE